MHMSIIRYHSPLRGYAPLTFHSILDRFANETLSRNGGSQYSFTPRVDIVETDKAYEIQIAVPGIKKEEFTIDVNDRFLTISGERKVWKDRKEANVHVNEIQYGNFSRVFTLPETIDESQITAEYNNGILEVVIPKDEKRIVKRNITVK